MPVNVIWDNDEKTIIQQIFINHWTWEELEESHQQIVQKMQSVPHAVDMIADLRESADVPEGHPLQTAYEHLMGLPDNRGIVVGVSDELLHRMMAKSLGGLFTAVNSWVFVARTMPEAYEIIRQRRETDDVSG